MTVSFGNVFNATAFVKGRIVQNQIMLLTLRKALAVNANLKLTPFTSSTPI
jgi:hypothetical protein